MVKTITLKWLQSQGACKESLEAWQKETDHNTFATLNRLVVKNPEWGSWLICRLMNKKQAVQYAIFAAEQVIDIYEGKYPDKRPRNAIEAAKAYLKNPSKKTKAYAADAAAAGYGAGYAATYAATYAAAAATYAADYAAGYDASAAAAATYAANAAGYAAADAAGAYAAGAERRKMKAKILKYGIRLLEQSRKEK
jgi:hypothetical protein